MRFRLGAILNMIRATINNLQLWQLKNQQVKKVKLKR